MYHLDEFKLVFNWQCDGHGNWVDVKSNDAKCCAKDLLWWTVGEAQFHLKAVAFALASAGKMQCKAYRDAVEGPCHMTKHHPCNEVGCEFFLHEL